MPTWIPTRDISQDIIDIAKRIEDSGLSSEHFATVFEAIMRVEFSDERALTSADINSAIGQNNEAVVRAIRKAIWRAQSNVVSDEDELPD